jgi:opacity protein-like surface antigen
MRSRCLSKLFKTASAMALVWFLAGERPAHAQKEWSFDISPYLWVASVELETSLSDQTSSTPGIERFDTRISAGAMLAGHLRYRSIGLFVDFAWLELETEAINPRPAYSTIVLESDFIHSTVAASYRIPLEGQFQIELLAGARLWHVANELEAASGLLQGFNATTDKTWADPIIGATFNYALTQKWSVGLEGFVGGFGVSADFAGELFAGATYRITDRCSATLGYRYLYEEYDRSVKFNLNTHGFLLGVGFHF